ncbi:MAG: hypothetical protein MI919_42810, partial [Holophagales bacterium]|nr:hypothetical protein [Holophagales bacterium]
MSSVMHAPGSAPSGVSPPAERSGFESVGAGIATAPEEASHTGVGFGTKDGGAEDAIHRTFFAWLGAVLPIPMVFYLAAVGLGAVQKDPSAAAEAGFLGFLGAATLVVIAALAPRQSFRWVGPAAFACVAAMWVLHRGPERGAVVSLVLVIALSHAGFRSATSSDGLLLRVALPLVLGAQILARPDLLLAPVLDLRTTVSLLLLPVVSALALAVIAERFGAHRALALGALAVSAVPGFNVTSTLCLLAAASGARAGDARRALGPRGVGLAVLLLSSGVLAVTRLPGLGLSALLGGAALAAIHGSSSRTAPSGIAGTSLVAGVIVAWVGLLANADAQSLVPGLAILTAALPAGEAGARMSARLAALVAGAGVLAGGYPWLRSDPWGAALVTVGGPLGLSTAAVAVILLAAAVLLILLADAFERRPGRSPAAGGSGRGEAL